MSVLLRRLFHRRLSKKLGLAPPLGLPPIGEDVVLFEDQAIFTTMPKTIRELLSDTNSSHPRYVRLHNANYSSRELLSEILSCANRIVRRVSDAQLSSNDRRWWPVREMASKWDSIRAFPEMLQDVDTELLKILVLDAYADLERLERSS